jgi:hypothetical protein
MDVEKIISKAGGLGPSGGAGAFERIESSLAGLGMGQPIVRLGVGFGLGWLGMQAFKPSFAYDAHGNAKPWQMLDPENPDAAVVPWWAPPLASGALLGLFI